MDTGFDSGLIEFTAPIAELDPSADSSSDAVVDVYKVGGGTLGESYSGDWGYRVRRGGRVEISGEDLRTGMPRDHRQTARLVLGFIDDPTERPTGR